MILRRGNVPFCQSIKIGHYECKKENKFKYLDTILTVHNDIANEIAARIQVGNKCYFGLMKLLKSREMSGRLKKRLYMRPVNLYGSETWSLKKKDENKFSVFERKILRRIFGRVKDNLTGE